MNNNITTLSSAEEIKRIRKSKGLKADISGELLGALNLDITKDIVEGIKKFSTSNKSSVRVFIPNDLRQDIKKISSAEGLSSLKKNKNKSVLAIIDSYLKDKGFQVSYLKKVSTSQDRGGGRDSYTDWYIVISL